MNNKCNPIESCTVAHPRDCNYATSPEMNATSNATTAQPNTLKALAAAVLTRNSQCNPSATMQKRECNFNSKNEIKKLHAGYTLELNNLIEKLHQHYGGPEDDWHLIVKVSNANEALIYFRELVRAIT